MEFFLHMRKKIVRILRKWASQKHIMSHADLWWLKKCEVVKSHDDFNINILY